MKLKFLTVLMIVMMTGSQAFSAELPDSFGQWRSVNKNILPLVTEYNQESHGRVVYVTYKKISSSAVLDVILTEGTGAGNLYVPEKIRSEKGMMPSDSGFELLEISGHRAILERQSFMPLALSVKAGDNITLTLESSQVGRDELVKAAEEILSSWKATESD
ncbi:MAG: hypothetical protein IJR98_01490 [Synergistaceae bacterium]|nr:hypothetical protein [Synergistaceae bacterium]